jgi:site-specific DNA-methyltransferase (adenine-specific)
MWECFKRVIKPRGAVVLTASGKFTYKLVMSNFEWFKYEWVWIKNAPVGFLDAPRQPMKYTEYVLIFGQTRPAYFPIMRKGKGFKVTVKNSGTSNYGNYKDMNKFNDGNQYYPQNIIRINNQNYKGTSHPTQKPVALFEYLIRTYTQPGETVFDPCVGSGTTAIAARNTGRNFIVGDSSAEYIQVARERLAKPYTLPLFDEQTTEQPKPEQMGLL